MRQLVIDGPFSCVREGGAMFNHMCVSCTKATEAVVHEIEAEFAPFRITNAHECWPYCRGCDSPKCSPPSPAREASVALMKWFLSEGLTVSEAEALHPYPFNK